MLTSSISTESSISAVDSRRGYAILLMVTGSIAISFGGLVQRMIEVATPWQINVYRSTGTLVVIATILAIQNRKQFFSVFRKVGRLGFIAGALLFVVSGTPNYSLSLEAWASLIALGTLGTGIGYLMFVWLIENIGSVRASLVTYIVPVLALFLGWLILDESIGVNTIAGFLLIITGVATVMRGQAPTSQRLAEPVAPSSVGE